MRVLAVSHACVTDVNQQFYAELERLGHEVTIVVPRNFVTQYSNRSTSITRWSSFTGDIVELPVVLRRRIQLHYYRTRLSKVMHRYRPHALFVEEEPYSVSAAQAFIATKNISLKRVIYSAQNIHKTFPAPFKWMEQYVLKNADAVAVTSDSVSRVLLQKGFKGTHIPFPLGVDTEQFRPSAEYRKEIRNQLGFVETDFVVGYVGRFVKEKGIESLIGMVPQISYERMKLVCVGNGPLLNVLEASRQAYPETVSIAQNVQHREIPQWMNAFDCLILPSITTRNWKEQFGRVILEAMACRVPVLGSDCGEIPALINSTQGGWVFPEGHSQRAVDILKKVRAQSSILKQAEVGLQAVRTRLSKRAQAERFSDCLESIPTRQVTISSRLKYNL